MNDLPTGWELIPLGQLCIPVTKVDPVLTGRQSIRYVDIGSVDGTRHVLTDAPLIDAASAPTRARQVLAEGDTVFSTVRPYLEKIARVGAHLDEEFASTGFCVLRPGPRLNHGWLFHYATSRGLLDQVLPHQRGVSYPAVRDKDVLAANIPLPPLDEQRRIVEILEDHLSRLDAAQTLVTRSETRLAMWLEVLLEDSISGDWPQYSIGSIATIGSGATPLKSRKDYYDDGTVPWVTSGALNDSVVTEPTAYITELAVRETAVKMWPAGTLLVAMYGEGKTRGRCSELAIPATTNQACAAIVMKPEHSDLQPWLKLVLRSRYQRMRRLASGGVQPNLSLGLIKSMMVPIPAAGRRAELLAAVRRADDSATQLRRPLQAVSMRTHALRRSLLSAAFSGQLTR